MNKTVDYGIDLGTTNSCIARWEGGSVRVFQNNDQMNVTPSAVHILKTGRIIVGRRAYAAILTDPENVSVEFKRWMGQKDRKRFPAAQRELSAEELSAEVLKSLREDVRRQTGADVTTAVINRSGCIWCTPMRGYCPVGRACRTAGSTTAAADIPALAGAV
jgi:molecular chaperone DnaK